MIRCFIGYTALILFIYALAFKKLNKLLGKIKMKKLIYIHAFVGMLMLILVIVHVVMSRQELTLNFGTIALFLVICIFLTGIIVSHIKKVRRKIFIYIHITLSFITLFCVIFHIIECYILL